MAAETLMQQSPELAAAVEAASGEMAAVAERCLLAHHHHQQQDGAVAEEGNHDMWLGGGGDDDDGDDEEEGSGKALAPGKNGKGFMSLFTLYDMPDVVLVDMGRVAERLAGAGGDVGVQLECLAQLEGVRRPCVLDGRGSRGPVL